MRSYARAFTAMLTRWGRSSLSPFDLLAYGMFGALALALMQNGRFEEAGKWATAPPLSPGAPDPSGHHLGVTRLHGRTPPASTSSLVPNPRSLPGGAGGLSQRSSAVIPASLGLASIAAIPAKTR